MDFGHGEDKAVLKGEGKIEQPLEHMDLRSHQVAEGKSVTEIHNEPSIYS